MDRDVTEAVVGAAAVVADVAGTATAVDAAVVVEAVNQAGPVPRNALSPPQAPRIEPIIRMKLRKIRYS
jgi:hypothetical protein